LETVIALHGPIKRQRVSDNCTGDCAVSVTFLFFGEEAFVYQKISAGVCWRRTRLTRKVRWRQLVGAFVHNHRYYLGERAASEVLIALEWVMWSNLLTPVA